MARVCKALDISFVIMANSLANLKLLYSEHAICYVHVSAFFSNLNLTRDVDKYHLQEPFIQLL